MGRPLRLDIDGAIHHVMNRGVDHQPVFFADVDRVEFGRRLADLHIRFGVETLAYCLMGNHYHLVLHTPNGGLSDAMHHLGSVYTRHTNDRIGRDGPLFRGRFRSIRVTSDSYLMWVTRYIHRNALDIAGVTSPDGYRWSSYRTYLGARPRPSFLNTALVLDQFDGDLDRLIAFTGDERPCFGASDGPVLTLGDLCCLVSLAIEGDDIAHGSDDRAEPRLGRTIELLVRDRIDPQLRAELDGKIGFPSDTARRMAVSRARRRAAEDALVARVLASVDATLSQFGHVA